ncbi:CDGSH iron-sulfur domain-containing protein 3, mitochondrial isoform X1 [Peromyscus eremicus]|uniref:CDGSH iron-sulfur domain-containing protein 3, mitochondrial isoform X1 n=2 Tax=Peromyscus eremicus TaxID=42410 RepID=UPI0027DE2576|nr:CDGSH iron-sulfur domain-containing protein 3, mitochondrial isoform X1 [Peromyscus eremicus]
MPRPASAATLFPTLLSLPRPLSLWSFPSQMGFRRPPFYTDFIFLFPNHICRPALSKLGQRREISSWLARWFPKDPAKPVVAQKTPIRLELVAGKTYRWCVCGRSKKQPFCDGSHFFQHTGLWPLKFKAQETRTVALCTCKATQRPPYCDGTHKSEQVQKAEVGSPL